MAATTTYLSLGAFYAADKRRDISREHDVGLWWLGDDWHAPRFRAAWVAQTGELYVMQHEGTPGGGRDVVGEWGSLRWLVERLGPDVPASVRHAAGLAGDAPEPRFARPVASDVA
jgi:hypothetical protein